MKTILACLLALTPSLAFAAAYDHEGSDFLPVTEVEMRMFNAASECPYKGLDGERFFELKRKDSFDVFVVDISGKVFRVNPLDTNTYLSMFCGSQPPFAADQ